jgi:hypothetical protein
VFVKQVSQSVCPATSPPFLTQSRDSLLSSLTFTLIESDPQKVFMKKG